MYAAFSYFDKDGSGYITPDELQTACQQFGLDDTQLEDIIREVDQDNVKALCANCFFTFLGTKILLTLPLTLTITHFVLLAGWSH